MERKFMAKASFSEMCKIIEGKEDDIKECIKSIFGIGMIFFPGIMCKEVDIFTNIANGISLLDAKNVIDQSIEKIENVLKNKENVDFYTKYNNVQLVQVLIVFAAYFDSIKLFLPDENGIIELSADEKYILTEESIKEYINKLKEKTKSNRPQILEYDLSMPNSIENFEKYLKKLKSYYEILNQEFIKFYEKLLFWEEMKEHKKDKFRAIIRELPDIAVENYKKQYYQLAVIYPEFFVWSNIKQHETISTNIDVGFQEIAKLIAQYYRKNKDYKAISTLEKYEKKYKYYIEETIVDINDVNYSTADDIIFPSKKEIFVPQSYKALIYEKEIDLENAWAKYKERENIGKFISDTLRHPVIGEMPMLILGLPGAGKTLLCNMLAAQILLQEYHVIIVRLRDAAADDTIMQQINQQIEKDFSNKCSWSDIVESEPEKPFLLIFDGYDELLQASGRTHADYIKKIAEFQKEQKVINGILVKCIITSRIILIGKALIPENSAVIKLNDFDDNRIKLWIDIWNRKNASYFERNKLESFEIDTTSKVYELSKQPLLLLMLALYDINGNILKKQKNLNRTQLYDNLIREFITREKRKNSFFRGKQQSEQGKIIDEQVRKIGIAAIGMYNRKVLYIHSTELQKDIEFIDGNNMLGCQLADTELSESEKVLDGFFFIHKSKAVEGIGRKEIKNAAYEFLHNTFGEFLTANYIVYETRKVLNQLKIYRDNDMLNHWNLKTNKSWCICLAYAPLFSRPVVIKMIHEWSYTYLCNEGMELEEIDTLMEILINMEIKEVISGENVLFLKEILEEKKNPFRAKGILDHLAIYSLNLIMLRTVIGQREYRFKFDNFKEYKKEESVKEEKEDCWNKLMYLWKSVFSERELQEYAEIFTAKKNINECLISYKEDENGLKGQQSGIWSLYNIEQAMGNDRYYVLISTLLGKETYRETIKEIRKNDFRITARYTWNYLLSDMYYSESYYSKSYIKKLDEFRKFCQKDGDFYYIFVYYLYLNYLLREKKIKCNNEEGKRFIVDNILNGIYPSEFKENIMQRDIYNLVLNLLDYMELNEENMERIYDYFVKIRCNNFFVDEFEDIAWDITVRLINRCNERNFEFNEKYIYSFIERWTEGGIRERDQRYLMKRCEELLNCSYNLLMYTEYELGIKMFIIYIDKIERLKGMGMLNLTFEQKGKIIVCLNIMYLRKKIEYKRINFIFRNIIEGLSLKKLFDFSEESIYAYTSLMCIDRMYGYHKNFLKEARWIITRNSNKFSLRLYKQMMRFAKKFGYKEFEVELKLLIS